MSLTLPPGHRVLRFTALTPANCGDTGGSAAVDRPVAIETWSGLPYLPSSALKGVLAGRRGNVHLPGGALNRERTKDFGAPADDQIRGQAGSVVFGDAEALAFPVLLRDGRRAIVAVASTLWQLARQGILSEITLLRVDDQAFEGEIAHSDLPPLPLRLKSARFGVDRKALTSLLGSPAGPVIVAAPGAAKALWQAAVEERTLTALENDRTVRRGSLRTIELIPAGALFVSLVSNLSRSKVDLGAPAPIQLGAWEGTGLGYFAADVLDRTDAGGENGGDASRAGTETGPEPKPRHELMRDVYRAMKQLAPRKEAARTRSAIFDLGPRLARRGLETTLAFCLAKAGGGEDDTATDRVRRERAAYRWILQRLFVWEDDLSHAELHAKVVAAIQGGAAALPPDFDETRLWLRRYAETMLPKEKDGE